MIRLLHVVLSLGPGGTERLVLDMANRVQGEVEVSICCIDDAGDWAPQATARGIEVVALHRRPGFALSLAPRIARLLRERAVNAVHCHHYSPFVYGSLAAALERGVRLVYTEHGRLSDAPPSRRRRLANTVLGRLPGRFVAVSSDLRDHMVAGGLPRSRVEVIHNGIDPGPPPDRPARARARQLLDLPADAQILGSVARFDPVKQLPTMIEAFAEIAAVTPRAVLVLVGDGPARASLTQRTRDRPELAGRVRFLGHRDDVRQLLPAFDIYLNSSETEGLSVTILEAMATALPVVATRVGGTPELVADGVTGILVPPRDPTALGDAAAALLSDPERMCLLGTAGRARLEAHFTIGAMTQAYLRLYED